MQGIPFNKLYYTGKEQEYIALAMQEGKLSGGGEFTKRCQDYFRSEFNLSNSLLTTSCTSALEMASLLLNIQPGDEIILPSYTFVSTANPFLLRGATLIFADSCKDNPNIDPLHVESLISKRTKAIVVVHYAGISCDMNAFNILAEKYHLAIIEDAAQGFGSYYITNDQKHYLGSIGDFGALSFHATKNLICGEGGLFISKDLKTFQRAEIIWEKGTNRKQFFRGEINKYEWIDIGSSYLPSELQAAFLWAQLNDYQNILKKRVLIWESYQNYFKRFTIEQSWVPEYSGNNGQMYYIVLPSRTDRNALIEHCKNHDIQLSFHYEVLHQSPYFKSQYSGMPLNESTKYSEGLVRLPLYTGMTKEEVEKVCEVVGKFFEIL